MADELATPHDVVTRFSSLEGSVKPLAELLYVDSSLRIDVIEFAMALGVRAAERAMADYAMDVEKKLMFFGQKLQPPPRITARIVFDEDITR